MTLLGTIASAAFVLAVSGMGLFGFGSVAFGIMMGYDK